MAKPNRMPMPIRGMPMARPPMAPPPPMPGKTPPGFATGTPDVNSTGNYGIRVPTGEGSWAGPTPAPVPITPIPPAPLGQGLGLRKAIFKASGDANVGGPPAPGQTITNGSWTGPQPTQAPAPIPPAPLGQGLGLRRGLIKAASGTPDVMPQRTDNYDNPPRGTPMPYGGITRWGAGEATPGDYVNSYAASGNVFPQNFGEPSPANKMRGSTPGYATGTKDVPPEPVQGYIPQTGDYARPSAARTEGGATQSYDPQTGSYPPVDEHFVAHLRAAMGMAPKVPAYAGGTSNVGNGGATGSFDPTLGGATGSFEPNVALPPQNGAWTKQPGILDGLISGNLGPFHVGAAGSYAAPDDAVNHQMPAPNEGPMIASPPGQFGRNAPNHGQYDVPPAAPIPPATHPVGRAVGVVNPNAGAQGGLTFGGVMDALTSVPQTVANHLGFSKNIADPPKTDAVSKAVGATPEHANAMLNPLHYTRDEFIQAIANEPLAVTEKLWAMQHYLNPQQQLQSDYAKGLDRNIMDAESAQPPQGAAGKTLAEWQKKTDAQVQEATAAKMRSGRFVMEGPQAVLDSQQGQ